MANAVNCLYEFGHFVLDPAERLLSSHGRAIPLSPKAFDVLLVLVQRSGHLVEKHALIEAVWPGLFIEEGNLAVMVSVIRKALGSDNEKHKYIETVSKRGYRFVASVRRLEGEPFSPLGILGQEPAAGPTTVTELLRPEQPSSASSQPLPQAAPASESSSGLSTVSRAWSPASTVPASSALSVLGAAPSPDDSAPQLLRVSPPLAIRTRAVRGWRVAVPVIALLATIFVALWVQYKKPPTVRATGASPVRSLAILPFTTMGGGPEDEYLGLGMSDAVTTKLGNTGKIIVRPTSAMARYVGASRDPEAAGKEQGVDAVLDGRMQRAGDKLRLTVQLIRVGDGSQIWGQTFDAEYTNLFAVEDAVSEEVVRSIQLTLTGEERKRLAHRSTQNSEAYQAYVKGRYFCNKRTTEGLQTGLRYFQEAVALDPGYSRAYVGIADSYALQGLFTVLPPKVAFPKAKEAALKALETDPDLAEAHATLGFVNFYYDWDGLAAENEFRQALRSDPNYAIAHTWYAEDLAAMGRFTEALAESKRGVEADPLSLTGGTTVGLVSYFAGDNGLALESFRKTVEIDSNFPRVHFRMGNALLHDHKYAEALAEFQRAVQLSGGSDVDGDEYYRASIGEAYALAGNLPEARRMLAHMNQLSQSHYVPAYSIALIYVGMGDKDRAFEWLRKAADDRSTSMAFLKVDPLVDTLRDDPRFASLLKEIKF